MRNLQVNGERLWANLMSWRDRRDREGWCGRSPRATDGEVAGFYPLVRRGGCTVRVAGRHRRRPGRDPNLAGHGRQPLDIPADRRSTAPRVMAGLEVVRTLNDLGYQTSAIDIVA
jgi:hypothetical protein